MWSRPWQFVRRGQTIARARPDAMAKASVDVIVAMRDPMPYTRANATTYFPVALDRSIFWTRL